MIEEHRAKEAEATVMVLPVKIEGASGFGIVEVDEEWRITGFEEKPVQPKPIPGEPGYALVSMGNYLFNTTALIQALASDTSHTASSHDFGRDIFPALVDNKRLYAYDFRKNSVPAVFKREEPSYWRDVGTIEAYFEANMDLRAIDPSFNLYNRSWPIRSARYDDPPTKFVFDEEGRRGEAHNSVTGDGTIISGSVVRGCIVGTNVRIHSYCAIEDSVIMNWVEIGRGCRIRRAIIDKHNVIPPGTEIGYNADRDRERYFVSESGIVVIPRGEPKTEWLFSGS